MIIGAILLIYTPAVGPHRTAAAAGLLRAFENGGELRPANTGLHARGAHRTRSDTNLDDVAFPLTELLSIHVG